MKRVRVLLTWCLILLFAAAALPARAETAQAEDLTGSFTFDFGSLKKAERNILRRSSASQKFKADASFSIQWEETRPDARLCIQWVDLPENVRITQYDANGTLLSEETVSPLPETITPLLPDARKAVVQAGDAGMRIWFCAIYGAGELPDPFHDFRETPDHLDYLLISTHPDDDVLFLGSIVPVYGAEQGYVGTIVYVTNGNRERITEAENGAWAMGVRYRPVFFGMPDISNTATEAKKSQFRYDDLLLNLVRTYRQLHPLVVFAQDTKGEYGHWQHKLTSQASREAFKLAADPTYDPESAEQYGTWQVQKVYIHLHPENEITVDAHTPLTFFDGKNAFDVARAAYKKHASQQQYWFSVSRDSDDLAFNRFGMAEGVVPAGEDIFDNIDESLLFGYVPPTPEPTEVPTPEPTEAPTPEPVKTTEPAETPAYTESPAIAEETPSASAKPAPEAPNPAPEKQSYTRFIVLGGALAALITALAVVLIIRKRNVR